MLALGLFVSAGAGIVKKILAVPDAKHDSRPAGTRALIGATSAANMAVGAGRGAGQIGTGSRPHGWSFSPAPLATGAPGPRLGAARAVRKNFRFDNLGKDKSYGSRWDT